MCWCGVGSRSGVMGGREGGGSCVGVVLAAGPV